jgi:hypothetical protein
MIERLNEIRRHYSMKMNMKKKCEIKARIAMAKAAFNRKRTLFTRELGLNLRNKPMNY